MPFDGWKRELSSGMVVIENRAERDLRILRAARVQIAARGGWHRGGLGEPGISMCAIGWLHEVGWDHGDRDYEGLARRLLWPALPWHWRLVNSFWALAVFNDVWWRRQKRMVRLYSRAIRLAERRAGL